ncbi:MAG: hypothetical protein Q7P63_01330 [Verrucomicrobiota bacterium JB022]|nr:hypothetical protein [Verrucomicrobiota bacterium JB022]
MNAATFKELIRRNRQMNQTIFRLSKEEDPELAEAAKLLDTHLAALSPADLEPQPAAKADEEE